MKCSPALFALLLLTASLGGCARPTIVNPVITVPLGGRTFTLEVAATPDSQKAGLSDRDSLPADHGLIYVYTDETEHYRTEDAHMPLDIIFVNSAGVIVSIHELNANDRTSIASDKPAFYAIEVNHSAAAVKVGDTLTIPPAASRMAIAQMQIGKTQFALEVAATAEDQEIGLMSRDVLPAGRGIIFVFPEEKPRDFWMKNTRISLDIIFLDSAGVVVSIRQMAPFDLNLTSSNFPARYAVELNKGAAEASGVKVGDRLTIPPQATAKKY
jgi:hypothetical protein